MEFPIALMHLLKVLPYLLIVTVPLPSSCALQQPLIIGHTCIIVMALSGLPESHAGNKIPGMDLSFLGIIISYVLLYPQQLA